MKGCEDVFPFKVLFPSLVGRFLKYALQYTMLLYFTQTKVRVYLSIYLSIYPHIIIIIIIIIIIVSTLYFASFYSFIPANPIERNRDIKPLFSSFFPSSVTLMSLNISTICSNSGRVFISACQEYWMVCARTG